MGNNGFSSDSSRSLGSPLHFSPIDVDERIGRALVSMIFLKYGALDAGEYATPQDLRGAASRALPDVAEIATSLAHVASLGQAFVWDPFDLRRDDSRMVLHPSDRAADQPGRWVAAPFRDYRGPYYWHGLEVVGLVDRAIPLDARGDDRPSLLSLARGKTPAAFVSFMGKDKPEVADQEPGALLHVTLNFAVRVISKNWRGTPSARYGSGIADEAAQDPGTSKLIGYIEWLLRGSQGLYGAVPGGGYAGRLAALGLSTSPWTDYARVIIGAHNTGESFGKDMRLMDTLDVSVRLFTERRNEPQDLTRLDAFTLQQTQPLDGSAIPIGPPQILFARKDSPT